MTPIHPWDDKLSHRIPDWTDQDDHDLYAFALKHQQLGGGSQPLSSYLGDWRKARRAGFLDVHPPVATPTASPTRSAYEHLALQAWCPTLGVFDLGFFRTSLAVHMENRLGEALEPLLPEAVVLFRPTIPIGRNGPVRYDLLVASRLWRWIAHIELKFSNPSVLGTPDLVKVYGPSIAPGDPIRSPLECFAEQMTRERDALLELGRTYPAISYLRKRIRVSRPVPILSILYYYGPVERMGERTWDAFNIRDQYVFVPARTGPRGFSLDPKDPKRLAEMIQDWALRDRPA